MKRNFILISLFLWSMGAISQPFNNSWIDYSKPYYKFNIVNDGVYRISQTVLQNAGLGSVPVEQLQLWRNGVVEPFYSSVASGLMGAGDFIEIYGKRNDGKPDKKLYTKPEYQLTDYRSIVSDTASYFLTVTPSGGSPRFTEGANNVAGNSLPAEAYFMNTKGIYFNELLSPGFAQPAGGVYVFSSSYEQGEGWAGNPVEPSGPRISTLGNLNLYMSGPAASVTYGVVGNAFNTRSVKLQLNNTYIDEVSLPYFNFLRKTISNIPLTVFTNPNNAAMRFYNTSSVQYDRYNPVFWELTYPSTFNFSNQKEFSFELPASAQGNYLEITNFDMGSVAPVLYDYTDMKRYTADITSTPGKIKFALPPSLASTRKFRLVTQSPTAITAVTSIRKREFINYGLAANQGNYIIISNPVLYTSTSGKNYVDEYKQYRNSVKGGGFNSIVVDINEISDQFAYGISKHPLAIKDFIQYAAANFSPAARYVFLIGRGVIYDEYVRLKNSTYRDMLNLVPTFGSPGSDILLSSPYGISTPTIPIGRLSAVKGDEVGDYLTKVMQYEDAQQSQIYDINDQLWKKNVVQISGGKTSDENFEFRSYMNGYASILSDTMMGSNVELFTKTSNVAVQNLSSKRIEELFEQGIGILAYFGHSSANTLEYNLDDPSSYNNAGKYPMFIVSGCTAGNTFVFDSTRFISGSKTISENFVLSPERGSISFMASTHYGIGPYLNEYNKMFYKLLSTTHYGGAVGDIMKQTIKNLRGDDPGLGFFSRTDLEEMNLQGDPAIKFHATTKPDYVIESPQIKIDPGFISVSENNFKVNVKAFNLGKAINDSISFVLKRVYPTGNTEEITRKRITGIKYVDSLEVQVPIVSTRDKGLNKIIAIIDDGNLVDEMSESNNSVTKEFYIYEDEARPFYPANYAVIENSGQKLFASTANPLSPAKQYDFELDTTMLFNSPFKIARSINAQGGILEFDPGITYQDSVVYYWRVSIKPQSGLPEDYHWLTSSFQYIPNRTGFAQGHYYQHLSSVASDIFLDSLRSWEFIKKENYIFANSGVYPTAATLGSEMQVNINGATKAAAVCTFDVLTFTVIDPLSLEPWINTTGTGRFGSLPVCQETRKGNFEFPNLNTVAGRKTVMDFMDTIPDNFFVVLRYNAFSNGNFVYADQWAADTSIYGSGISLYHKLREQGFYNIDSFDRKRTFIFMFKKNSQDFEPGIVFSEGLYDKISIRKDFLLEDTLGLITSPVFGPSKAWKSMHWQGKQSDMPATDIPTVSIWGIDKDGNQIQLLTADESQKDVDISGISAAQYPYLQLKMKNIDRVNLTPYQLNKWMVLGDEVPEGALAPSIFLSAKDTLRQGEFLQFGIAFKNISSAAFDSMKINLTVIDNKNVTHVLPMTKMKPLISGDTIKLVYNFDTKLYPGTNTLFVDFNPDNNQPEQTHFNNFLYHNFYVIPDNFNPLMDVTFDGVRILNRDIVSGKPHIVIKLQDESEFLKLQDTSLIKVKVKFPDGTLKDYYFNSDTLKFIPATGNGNTATIEFTPAFDAEDDDYELFVTGKDAVGNEAGKTGYHVTFRVIGKPMISNLLNYPNPFTTSTAFVFTITGSEVPQNLRIQILTVTGKVVREITKEELGPLHIGRNITEYKWDGTDTYGQKLANGVYLYRVLTNLNGRRMDKFTDRDEKTEQYFRKGYGKMYLMR
ncbi:MAG: C25 family cysteine peptidase [Chitinophagaceae bacterium]|nr:C25 family cysteine peptidase [Chitinophagaceae bacterium]